MDGTNYSTTVPKGTEAGNYTVYFKVVGGDNYADTPAASFTVTIAGADAGNTSPAAADKLTYNGEAQKLVTGGSVNIRSAPGVESKDIGTAHKGDLLVYQAVAKEAGGRAWFLIIWKNQNAWISSKYSKLVE